MITVKVTLKDHPYNIMIGEQILKNWGEMLQPLDIGRDAVVVTHPKLNQMYGRVLTEGLKKDHYTVKVLEVPEGERSKSSRQAFKLIDDIVSYDVKKRIFLAAFGGGVIGDLTGFVAAIYRRGIPYVQVPTTFLAQIDSAIGGKTAVDSPLGKNLIGVFYQPRAVFSDIRLLATLNRRQLENGLAEAIKYGIICDPRLFHTIEQNAARLLAGDLTILQDVVFHCSRIKAKIIMSDEKETRGMRTILNFGHTVGHAIEAAQQYRYYHGEAIAMGMRVAVDISRRMGLLNEAQAKRIEKALTSLHLPQKIERISADSLYLHLLHDKKFQGEKNRFVLINGIGSAKVVSDVPEKIIREAMAAYLA